MPQLGLLGTFLLIAFFLSSTVVVSPHTNAFADSSDVTECSTSFSGTLSDPFNAETMITINALHGPYNVEFDYAIAFGDDGPVYLTKSSALEPPALILVGNETISSVLTSGETILDGVFSPIVLYHKDISDCDILFSRDVPASKRMILPIVSITEIEPFKFLVRATVPDIESAKDFTKQVILYASNIEASVYYVVPNVTVVAVDDLPSPAVFCGRVLEDFDNVIMGTSASNSLVRNGDDDLIRGFGGDDTIDGKGGDDCIIGNEGNDILQAGPGKDAVYGGIGDDEIYGNDGIDTLYGNSGDDLISGGEGDDYIAGKSGNDSIFGNNGNDKLFGNEGDDFLKGGDGDDVIFGGEGRDALLGNTGADRLSGQEYDYALVGGRGDDKLSGGEGVDVIDGGRDIDTAYDDSINYEILPPIHCEEQVIV